MTVPQNESCYFTARVREAYPAHVFCSLETPKLKPARRSESECGCWEPSNAPLSLRRTQPGFVLQGICHQSRSREGPQPSQGLLSFSCHNISVTYLTLKTAAYSVPIHGFFWTLTSAHHHPLKKEKKKARKKERKEKALALSKGLLDTELVENPDSDVL